jgi:hypothetical protein
MGTCLACDATFVTRTGGKPQRYCSSACRIEAANARRGCPVATNQTVVRLIVRSNQSEPPAPALSKPTPPLNIEWLDCYSDLHRCVAGRMNKSPTTLREFAVGMDRPPVGHVALVAGAWQGKVRRNGAVLWLSEPFDNLDDAKLSVERRLADSPEIAAEALRLAA